MAVTIRPIEAGDEPAWRKHWTAYNEFYQRTDSITEEITATTFSRFLNPGSSIKAAVAVESKDDSSEDVVGFVTWYPHPSTGHVEDIIYLNDLFVDPGCRNGGIGRKLIEYVYAEADKMGIQTVYW